MVHHVVLSEFSKSVKEYQAATGMESTYAYRGVYFLGPRRLNTFLSNTNMFYYKENIPVWSNRKSSK